MLLLLLFKATGCHFPWNCSEMAGVPAGGSLGVRGGIGVGVGDATRSAFTLPAPLLRRFKLGVSARGETSLFIGESSEAAAGVAGVRGPHLQVHAST
jgi:hypothetical protein